MIKKFRLYGDAINRWFSEDEDGRKHLTQIEVPYKEYDTEGDLVGEGTEDFSRDRWNSTPFRSAFVYIWDGSKRNKGGYRWFVCKRWITYKRKDASLVKQYFKIHYNASEVELR